MATLITFANCAYMIASIILAFSSHHAIFNLINISSYAIINYLEVSTSAFWAFLVSHISFYLPIKTKFELLRLLFSSLLCVTLLRLSR